MLIHTGLFVLVMLTNSAWVRAGASLDDVLRGVKARDESISSYRIVVRRGHIMSQVDPSAALAETVAGVDRSSKPQDVFTLMADRMRGGQPISWQTYSTVERGMRFKTVLADSSGPQIIYASDGERFARFHPTSGNRQVDLYPIDHAEERFSLAQLGLACGRWFDPTKVLDHDAHGDGVRITFRINDTFSTQAEFDSDLAIRELKSTWNDRTVLRKWYVLPGHFGTYVLPQIIVVSSPSGQSYHVDLVLVEELRLNPPIADEELRMPDIPDRATVVDYRQKPPRVEQYRKLPDKWEKRLRQPESVSGSAAPSLGSESAPGNSRHEMSLWSVAAIWALVAAVATAGTWAVYRCIRAK